MVKAKPPSTVSVGEKCIYIDPEYCISLARVWAEALRFHHFTTEPSDVHTNRASRPVVALEWLPFAGAPPCCEPVRFRRSTRLVAGSSAYFLMLLGPYRFECGGSARAVSAASRSRGDRGGKRSVEYTLTPLHTPR